MTAPDPRLEEIEARLGKVTPGPWEFVGADLESCGVPWVSVIENTVDCMSYCYGGSVRQEVKPTDAEFIAAAPADVAYLLAELRKAQDKLADAWDRGFATGKSRAMRAMSDEPNLPLTAPNPYRAAVADATGGGE